jgi:hypothetical protein
MDVLVFNYICFYFNVLSVFFFIILQFQVHETGEEIATQELVIAGTWCGTTNWWRTVGQNRKVSDDDWRHNNLVAAFGIDLNRSGMSQLSGTITWRSRLG